MATVFVGILVFAGIGAAAYATYRSKKKSGGCGCGCSGCSGAARQDCKH